MLLSIDNICSLRFHVCLEERGAQERSWHCSHKDCFPWQDGGGHSKGEIRVEILRQMVISK